MKQITALCDKIIELSQKTSQEDWEYFKDYNGDYKICTYYNEYDERGFKIIRDCIGTARSEEKARTITMTANHAAKLARALKKYRSCINAIEVKIDELEKEIEDIFK